MSKELDKAYEEIKDWSENLNQKVKEKSEELKNIYNQVIQIEKLASLGKLSATVAHELNNPLEGILTYSKLISRKLKSIEQNSEYEKLIEHLDLISSESARCGKIVKDLLLFSHKGEDIMETENIISVLDQSIMLIQHHLELNSIILVKEHCCDTVKLKCNPQKLQQAFVALLINAVEAMPGGGKIIVKVDCMKENIEIRIIDEGNGILPKDFPHIFEPFYSTKNESKGTGLGLAVTYGIITNHKGTISVEHTSNKGTTFLIILPIN
jgi:two-component system NtrC family sensor kinase